MGLWLQLPYESSKSGPTRRVSVPYSLGLWLQLIHNHPIKEIETVSVPYSLGLWLQRLCRFRSLQTYGSFSSLFIGIVAATQPGGVGKRGREKFQFPIHWDCGCNLKELLGANLTDLCFSSLFIGIVAATKASLIASDRYWEFQFPIHWDCGCNN